MQIPANDHPDEPQGWGSFSQTGFGASHVKLPTNSARSIPYKYK
jgi:hypothetical protein